MIIQGIVLESFSTVVGKIFIIDFFDPSYSPMDGGRLLYDGEFYEIKPHGMGKHDFFQKKVLYPKQVWSCILINVADKQKEVIIPSGAKITVEV